MSRTKILLPVVLSAALLAPTTSAHATYSMLCTSYSSCTSAGYSHHGYESAQRTSYWRMYTGTNCTNYVAYRLVTTNGMPNVRPASGVGNARDWGYAMSKVTDSTPTVGSVAWWGRTGNHVAYVEKVVSSSEILVSESNWGSSFSWRRITKSGSGWPDGFIHFKDPVTSGTFTSTPRPTFTGGETVGSVLSASTPAWSPTASFSYQWYADGLAISGATGSSYTLATSDLGKQVRVIVTATRSGYTTKRLASERITAPVTAGTFTTAPRPVFTGEETVGSVLRATTPAWAPTATFTYQWYRDGLAISGATDAAYTLAADDLGAQVRVIVTASRTGYASRRLASERITGPVVAGSFTSTPRPTFTGAESVGSTLAATTPAWSPDADLTYQWYRDGLPIDGASEATYTLAAADLGTRVRVIVTATRPGYVTKRLASERLTAPVVSGSFTAGRRPEFTGSESVGSTLSATTPDWTPTADFAYQWYADGLEITGATGATYTLGARDLGKQVRVIVTATRPGFTTRRLASVRITGPVTAGRFATTPRPEFTGSEKVGSTLSASTPPWSPTAVFTYQWYANGRAISGATRPTFTLTSSQAGQQVRVIVTGARSGFATLRLASVRITGPVAR